MQSVFVCELLTQNKKRQHQQQNTTHHTKKNKNNMKNIKKDLRQFLIKTTKISAIQFDLESLRERILIFLSRRRAKN